MRKLIGMSGKYLLDTNIVIALFAEDASVQRHIVKAEEQRDERKRTDKKEYDFKY